MDGWHWDWRAFSELDARALYEVLRLRSRVFVVEQRCPYEDPDGRDPQAHHLLAWHDGSLVAYLRAFPPDGEGRVRIGRVIVRADHRGKGAGRVLMRRGHERTDAAWGRCSTWVSAQSHLRFFYEDLGYRVAGAGYLEDEIPHLPMQRSRG